MESKKTIKSNEELYGDYELIPLNSDAVQQRIDFFYGKMDEYKDTKEYDLFNEYHKHWVFWQGIKAEHCIKEK